MTKRLTQFVRPYPQAEDAALRKKDAGKAIEAIWGEFEQRLKASWHDEPFSRSKNESAKYFLRREIYALGLRIMAHQPQTWSTADLVATVRGRVNRPDKIAVVFHDLLMCVYEDDSQIDRRERWQYAQELEYARRHGVPPELLCGFLLQSGPQAEVRKKLKEGYVEPGFRNE